MKSDDDYEVGYRKPPVEHRFKAGRSGNPAGRPRKKPNAHVDPASLPSYSAFSREAYRRIKLRDGEGEHEMSVVDAIQRSRAMIALKGNRLAQRDILKEVALLEEKALGDKVARFVELKALKKRGMSELAHAATLGRPAPERLPHPEDIRLCELTYDAWIAGPETEQDVETQTTALMLRDSLVLLSERVRRGPGVSQPSEPCFWGVSAKILDGWLPKRLRRNPASWVELAIDYRGLSRRDLDAQVEQGRRVLTARQEQAAPLPPLQQALVDRLLVDRLFAKWQKRRSRSNARSRQ